MKKLGLAILVVLIVGCSSLQSMFDDLSGGNTANRTNITQGTPLSRNNATQTSALPRRAKSYVLPVSYETAYTYRTDTSDPKMRNIPRNIEANRVNNPDEYIRQIVGYINENSANDFERVKKAHDLVALLIRYDAANFWANTVPAQDFRSVLKSKLAVCEGYSNLFKKICDELQIECEIVHGFGRGVGTSPFAGDTPTNSNHAWNIVTINNENYLVDCTWDSGYMDGRVSKQEYTTDWLFLNSEQFLYSHFPENQNQQLMEKSLSSGEFLKLPFYKPKFFEVVEEIDFNLLAINQVD
jgi:transglutaminase/protease-like cytokinesis protein 3